MTTVCTTPTPVVEVQELRRSLAAANSGDSYETSGTSKTPSTASKVTPLSTSKVAIGNHRGLVSTVESTTPALSEEAWNLRSIISQLWYFSTFVWNLNDLFQENSTPLQAPPKRLSVDVRRSRVILMIYDNDIHFNANRTITGWRWASVRLSPRPI